MKFASRTALPASFSASGRTHQARLRGAVAIAAVPGRRVRLTAAGKSFGQKRIEHAVEVAGACIMLAMFLMLALLA